MTVSQYNVMLNKCGSKESEGYQLLPTVIDSLAQHQPKRLYAELPLSLENFDAGFRKATYAALANAINGMAWWLHHTLGPSETFETLSYLGPNDLRHNIIILGCVKAGYTALFMSPRFSDPAHVNLAKQVNCTILLVPKGRPPVSSDILEHYTRVCQVPSLEELFDIQHPFYEFKKTFEKARNEPLVMLTTSGSTGFPKPIIWTHDWASSFIKARRLDPPLGFSSSDRLLLGGRLVCAFPPFHLFTTCGSTEQGFWHTIYPSGSWNPDTWKFMRLHPAQNIIFRHHSKDLYEPCVSRNKSIDDEQSVFKIFNDLQEYPTSDLFSPHLGDKDLWQFRGRADDLQSFITAEKFYPTAMERQIALHPDINALLFVGTRRPRGALLVELREITTSKEEAVERIWPVIHDANQTVPPTAQIWKELILFTEMGLPMKRTAKGTIERAATVKMYEQKLDELFAKLRL
ncbi:hypothetical protein G7Y89_g9485 [Cudoniella acicularis]|uniref:AMP-dependent synthetase/ligase domain-containing protein n=1 Tax=Cudoniella acicularis TaxID=354080 RepID=A0A8H4RG39_9HELO|nr:hypothetical protein G7Y89_g9485 [Cudoniella acicularis]